ncbi:MAG: AAA family ATPase [Candidatus Binatia bacterium]
MSGPAVISFPPFRLDLHSGRLWRGPDEVVVKPKAIALLAGLAKNPRRLLSKDELVNAVWGNTHISDDTLRSTLRELRRALGEDSKQPRYIETVHGRGYRFVAVVEVPLAEQPGVQAAPHSTLVGRGAAVDELRELFHKADRGQRQICFIVGEPGIGKTTLVDTVVAELRETTGASCAYGQCVSGYDEPYMPLIEALARLCRQPGGRRWIELMEVHAPTWLVEMPGVLDAAESRRIEARAVRISRDRMLRELAVAIEAITTSQALVLVLEDLHWSDAATLAAIDALARRTEMARLLVIATHRPVTRPVQHGEGANLAALRGELHLHELCRDIGLTLLSAQDVSTYLDRRFPALDGLSSLSQFIYRRSEGNPLMMAGHVEQLIRDRILVDCDNVWRIDGDLDGRPLPDGVRQMIEYQIDRLPEAEQRALEVASVAGARFSTELVGGIDVDAGNLAEELTRIARQRGLVEADGEALCFVHSLHREVFYERLSAPLKRQLHLQLGSRLESMHGDDTAAVAAELAMHYERGGDRLRAGRYLGQTAEIAIQRSSHEDAIVLVRRALEVLEGEAPGAARGRLEFELCARLGNCLTMTKGYVDPEVIDAFRRAFELAPEIEEDTPELIAVLAGLAGFHAVRGEHGLAAEVTLLQLQIAGRTGDVYDGLIAALSRAIVCLSIGQYSEAAQRFHECRDAYDPERHSPMARSAVTDPGVQCLGHGSLVLGGIGRLDQAREWSERAIALAERHSHLPSLVLSHYYAMTFQQFLRDVDRAEQHARLCFELGIEHGFPFYIPAAMVVGGWVKAYRGRPDEGAAEAQQGIEILKSAGAVLGQPLFLSMLAEAYGRAGAIESGLAVVSQGLEIVAATGEIASESFLHWARAELLTQRAGGSGSPKELREAETCLKRGIAVARRCGASMQVIGPATSLARLLLARGRAAQGRKLLGECIGAIGPCRDVPVLRQARELLATL